MEARYLYRGTTVGWPGNGVLQEQQITCTTTDPLVATLFAIECRNHGRPAILAVLSNSFGGLIAPPNHFAVIESAVNLPISPSEFANRAEVILDVDRALEILRSLGFQDLPVRLRDKEALRDELLYTFEAGQRLDEDQLHRFSSRMLEIKS
jgi:hypothetical protein